MLKRILKYSRKYIGASDYIHIDLKKLDIDKSTKEVYCLLDYEIYKISFEKKKFFQGDGIAGVYINDFAIDMSKNEMIVCGWEQSCNPPLKLYKLNRPYGKFLWVKTSYSEEYLANDEWTRERVDRFACKVTYEGETKYSCVKFVENLNIIVAISEPNVLVYDIKGNLLKRIMQIKYSNAEIDIHENIAALSDGNILRVCDLNMFKEIKKIEFDVKIKKIVIIESNRMLILLTNGELVILNMYKIENKIKVNKNIQILKNDYENNVLYFGNCFGDFGVMDYKGNIIYEDKIDDSIRDILIVNGGDNVIVATKKVEFYIYERINKINICKEINFKKFEERKSMKKIFLSYCWENEEIANILDDLFDNEGIKIIRDKHDLHYKGSIKEFMKTVRDADYVIMLISEEYLKSDNCMYEVLEFIKDDDFKERILPLVHKNTNIFKVEGRIDYINYWNEEYTKLKKMADPLSRESSVEISNEIKKRANIKNNISEFISIIADMNNIIYSNQIDDEQFEKIIKIIDEDNIEENPNVNDVIIDNTIQSDMQKNDLHNLYLNYVDKWCDFVDINNWNIWTSWMLGSGQPHVFIENWDKIEKLREWLFSRIWPKKLVELENSFENFRLVLNDLYNIFNEHCEKRGDMYYTEKFYRIDQWDEQLYQKLLGKYNFHVSLVQDLVLELTRAANYICDNIRKFINPSFRLEEGKLVVTYGPCMDLSFKTISPEYKDDERTLKPYPGLDKFKEIRINRDHRFGIGTSCDDPEFLKNS